MKSRQKCLLVILKRYLNPFKETPTTKSKCLIGLFGGLLMFAKGNKTYEIAELWIERKTVVDATVDGISESQPRRYQFFIIHTPFFSI